MEDVGKDKCFWEDYDQAEVEQHSQEWSGYWDRMSEEEAIEETKHNWEEAKAKRTGERLWDVSEDDLSLDADMW